MKNISYIDNMDTWREEFTFSTPIKIRFSETDMFGHVNNVSPFIYFEEARIEFLSSLGLFGENQARDGIPIVADLQCDYHKQLFFGQKIDLFVKASHVGTSSFDIHYMALNKSGEVCLTGRGRMVYVNPTTGKPVPLRGEMKEKLQSN
ncbi:acyl-CoA thioester hydrolase [Oceanobacillus limi]|uniref:Acyl-CoA thioester hydrolase n=1 Tax=Oceanobacillus limi TaxID=930131 RepID=A0A1I0EE59_9BACI|nr:thioesterase family protein [Oceanobacillus limi]SET43530.1 acyl-CoA thioester hydrolase [Oceanobacillus limi]